MMKVIIAGAVGALLVRVLEAAMAQLMRAISYDDEGGARPWLSRGMARYRGHSDPRFRRGDNVLLDLNVLLGLSGVAGGGMDAPPIACTIVRVDAMSRGCVAPGSATCSCQTYSVAQAGGKFAHGVPQRALRLARAR